MTDTPSPEQVAAERFQQDVQIDPNDLNRCFMEHASLFAYYGALQVHAMRREAMAKTSLEITEARTAKRLRTEAIEAKTKITESQLAQDIMLELDVIKARHTHTVARSNMKLADIQVEAFRQRRDMLVQIGATDREERKGDLRMMGNAGEQNKKSLAGSNFGVAAT